MRVVVTIGGSIIMQDLDHERFEDYALILKHMKDENQLFVVVGGGKIARDYIRIVRDLGLNESFSDDVGIDVTRLNAKILIMALGREAYPAVAKDFNQALEFSTSGKIVVMGGTEPAHSTDAVGSILAELVGADILINATSVDGLYDKDPTRYDDASMFEEVTPSQMIDLLVKKELKAGTYEFFDLTAIQIIKRSRIKTVIVNGNDPRNLQKATQEKIGTTIIPENKL
jgi:uridylate kinase